MTAGGFRGVHIPMGKTMTTDMIMVFMGRGAIYSWKITTSTIIAPGGVLKLTDIGVTLYQRGRILSR
jgi:hypothetical protein